MDQDQGMSTAGPGRVEQLALLDPARGREPDAHEWVRARAAVERIVAEPRSAPAAAATGAASGAATRRPGRRLALTAVGLAGAATAAVVVAGVLPGSGGTAYASWRPVPQEVSGGQADRLAQECAGSAALDAPAGSAADVLLAEQRGAGTIVIVQQGGSVAECTRVDPGVPTGSLLLADSSIRLPGLAADRITRDGGRGSRGKGTAEYSYASGRAGAGVTGVDLVTAGGRTVRASVSGGWWAAWWPGGEGGQAAGVQLVVHTAAGETTYGPGHL